MFPVYFPPLHIILYFLVSKLCTISKHAETSKETNYNTVKPDRAVTSIKQSLVLKGHLFPVLEAFT